MNKEQKYRDEFIEDLSKLIIKYSISDKAITPIDIIGVLELGKLIVFKSTQD